jgi:outer membrane protein OmpA-like peptidoglycan-associated protein
MKATQILSFDLIRNVGAGVLATTLVACGASATPQLADARKAYQEAEDSSAPTRAPGLLAEARVSLDRAERAHDERPGSANEIALAERAEHKARHAKAHAENRDADRYADEHERLEHGDTVATTRDVRDDDRTTREERIAADKRDPDHRVGDDREAGRALQNLGKVASVKDGDRGTVITLADSAYFPDRDEKMSTKAHDNLNQVADALKRQPSDAVFHVKGYTDSEGSDSDNKELSTRRAQAVADSLQKSGIPSSRIRVEGHGEADPIADNDSEAGRAANRRVEIVVDHRD